MKKIIKRIFKILGILLGLVFLALVIQFYRFSTPKTDAKIYEIFEKENREVFISTGEYRGHKYRVLSTFKTQDETKPTLVFIHGSIGSAMDFERYMLDEDILEVANIISYDRIGYGIFQTGKVQASIAFEVALLEDLIKGLSSDKIVLVGYSYGGPVAMVSQISFKQILLLAPAVQAASESEPWALNFYKWKLTRWLLPKVWKAASVEKISHAEDLKKFEDLYDKNPNQVVSIHGDKDWIVPIDNSYFLQDKLGSGKFELVTLKGAGHSLVWTRYDEIKSVLLDKLK